jgi:hypothetical protein
MVLREKANILSDEMSAAARINIYHATLIEGLWAV